MLIATAIMTVGLVMIATIFPVGVRLTGLSAERSVAAVVADEAFAKIQLYGLRDFVNWPAAQLNPVAGNPDPDATYYFCDLFSYTTMYEDAGPDGLYGTPDDVYVDSAWDEFLYPSFMNSGEEQKYHWSALCRRTDLKDVQVTVLITNKTFAGMSYHAFQYDGTDYVPSQTGPWPSPVRVSVSFDAAAGQEKILRLADDSYYTAAEAQAFFGEGFTIVDDYSGRIYRVLEVKDVDDPADGVMDLVLYDDWQPDPAVTVFPHMETVWVVPPGVGSDRYPCVGVFQRVIRFDAIQ
jgi:hypothetical protein